MKEVVSEELTSKLAGEVQDQLQQLFQYLHQHPELSFQEYQTRDFIYEKLVDYGYLDIQKDVGGGGVIARLKGGKPGPTIAFRADFDALAIQEETDLPYASESPGVMHACGHDGHTAILLTVARIMRDYQEAMKGTLVFLFQHAEEVKPGGAKSILASGALDDVDYIYGLHVRGDLPYDGVFEYTPGFALAASDTWSVHVQGHGGHAAMPDTTVDATVVGAFIVNQLQTIVSRNASPIDSAVVTVANFHAGLGADNIISDTASLSGTVRTFRPEVQAMIKQRMQAVVENTALAHGAQASLDYQEGYPPLYNHPAETETVRAILAQAYGESYVLEAPARMGGEDFAYYLQKIPGSFFYVRAGRSKDYNYPHHHPKFAIDEQALTRGAQGILSLIEALHFREER